MTGYSLGDAARILKISPARLRYWGRTSLLEEGEVAGPQPAFEFRDLLSVKSVLGLLERGVPLHRIRRSVEALRANLPDIERPLASLRLWAEGSVRVVVRHGGVLIEPDGQTVLDFEPDPSPEDAVARLAPAGSGAKPAARPPETAPHSAGEWFDRGCLLDSDRATYPQAIEAYRRALELAPDFADAHCNLGSVYFNWDRRTRARRHFECALSLEPRHVEANLNLAILLEEEGRSEQALRHYKIAVEADPLYADAHVSLALLYEKLALQRRARGHWRRYLQLEPAGAWSEVARRRLGSRSESE